MRRTIRYPLMVFGVAAALVVGVLAFQEWLRLTGNFHEVINGQFYRAAQLSGSELESYVKKYNIKTVLNLRGQQPDSKWYRDERQVVSAGGAQLIDYSMSATSELTKDQALELVAIMKSATKPILVHCKTGADRTGLVSVIYAFRVAGMDEETAEEQLAPRYGHFGIPILSPTFAMDKSWEQMEKLFGIEGS